MRGPKICFGQQPCGLFPKRFLISKIQTARRLQEELGGEIVFFYHDSDHDYRETITLLRDCDTGLEDRLNFSWHNKLQKKYTPLYLKKVCPRWQEETARRLPRFGADHWVDHFLSLGSDRVADFCLEFYEKLGLLEGIQVVRSSDPLVRKQAPELDDYFVDVPFEGEIVRARFAPEGLKLHRGGDKYLTIPQQAFDRTQISPTRDTRLSWMQAVVKCSHYVTGAGEMKYLHPEDAPDVTFVERDFIEESHYAHVPA